MLERIERLERERRQKEEDERLREAARQRAELERRQKAKREAEERVRFIRDTNNRILRESGVLSALADIERSRLAGTTAKHTLISDLDKGEVILAWGSRFTVRDGEIDYEKPFLGFGRGVKNYSCIEVTVNPEERKIEINYKFLSEQEWRNRELVLDRIAEAYLNPRRVNDREEPRRYSSSGSSSECCTNSN